MPPPRETPDGGLTFLGYGILSVDSGRRSEPAWDIELYGADWTSANVRMTQKDGFIIVFIPLAPAGRSSRKNAPLTGDEVRNYRSRYIMIDADALKAMVILIRMISAHAYSTLAFGFATAILVVEDRRTHGRRFVDCSRARLSTKGHRPKDVFEFLVTQS